MNPGLPVKALQKLVSLERLAFAAIAIAILLRIFSLGSREFWYDEVLSLLLSTGQRSAYQTPTSLPIPLAEYTSLLNLPIESSLQDIVLTFKNLLLSLLQGEPHPPIFFLSQHFWLRLFGNTEAAMRSLNLIFSIAAIFSGYSLGKVVLNHRSGLLLAAFIGINPYYLFHSLNVRMYAPLVLWTTLSATALLHLIKSYEYKPSIELAEHWTIPNTSSRKSHSSVITQDLAVSVINQQNNSPTKTVQHLWLWDILLIGSVTAGLLTFYFYGYWVITLAVLALYLDRKNGWQHSLRLATGVVITTPWLLWGGLKQIRNADLNRFGADKGLITAFLNHLQGLLSTLGTNLLLGDWVSSLPTASVVLAGCLVIALIITCILGLWRKCDRQNLFMALILGILPLLLGLAVDIITQKYTLGFGWGRTMIIILPGCLLLFVMWLEKAVNSQWRTFLASSLLMLYLAIAIGDFSLRQRSVFHPIADLVTQQINQPTLIAMNSKAWGHVMRLAYYIPPEANVMLLAQHPKKLADALEKVLNDENKKYDRVVWLDSGNPLWSRLKTTAEITTAQEKIQQVLAQKFSLQQSRNLKGTMDLDDFNIKLYIRSIAK
ncbi:MAG TPA: glycosyltransferase family 39 protein [Trichormus sp. M33_DOE_039]|nr:glycosyltransferase family 39 protein [Trichormus sp. M33_DOE_039]